MTINICDELNAGQLLDCDEPSCFDGWMIDKLKTNLSKKYYDPNSYRLL